MNVKFKIPFRGKSIGLVLSFVFLILSTYAYADSAIPITNYNYSFTGGFGVLKFQVPSNVTIDENNAIFINTSAGTIKLGAGQVWGFDSGKTMTVAQGSSTGQYKIYPDGDTGLSTDTQYECTMASTSDLKIVNISIGSPITPPSNLPAKLQSASYSFNMNGKVNFILSLAGYINKDNPLIINTVDGGISVGQGNAWGPNFPSGGCVLTVTQGNSANQFLVYPTTTVNLAKNDTTTPSYCFTLKSLGGTSVSSIGMGESQPVNPGQFNIKTYSYSYSETDKYGTLTFTLPNTVTVSKGLPIQISTSNGSISIGVGQAWGDNFTLGGCTDVVGQGLSQSNYLLYPTKEENLGAGQYSVNIAGSSDLEISGMSIGISPIKPIRPNPPSVNIPLRVGYVQLSGEHSALYITPDVIKASNVIVFAFAPLDKTEPPKSPRNFMKEIQYVMNNSSTGTVFLYSVGGANITPDNISSVGVSTVISNVMKQISYINEHLSDGSPQITGVDLDLENGITTDTIQALGTGFKSETINGASALVSLAPQFVSANGEDVSATNPYNLALSSGFDPSCNNAEYNSAINAIAPNYIFLQCYNTGGVGNTIDSYSESNIDFIGSAITAMNNLAAGKITPTTGFTNLSIEPGVSAGKTQIAIGLPSNRGGGGYLNQYTIFDSSSAKYTLGTSYDQKAILNNALTQLASLAAPTNGVMTWSLNNDSSPHLYQDAFAKAGAFSHMIFGGALPQDEPQVPFMNLHIGYGAWSDDYSGGAVVVTLIVDGQYYVFGKPNPAMAGTSTPLEPGKTVTWSTLTSLIQTGAADSDVESGALDQLAANAPTCGPNAGEVKGKVMVTWYHESKDSLTDYVLQSHPVDINLYTGCDNLISVGISNTNIDQIEAQAYLGQKTKNGEIYYGWKKEGTGDNDYTSTASGFQWSLGYTVIPEWMQDITGAIASTAYGALVDAAGGPALVFLSYEFDLQFTNHS